MKHPLSLDAKNTMLEAVHWATKCLFPSSAFGLHKRSFNAAVATPRALHPLPFTCPTSNPTYQKELLKCLNQIATSWRKHSAHAVFLCFPSWPQHQRSGSREPTCISLSYPSCPAATAALPPHCLDSPGSVESQLHRTLQWSPRGMAFGFGQEAPSLHVACACPACNEISTSQFKVIQVKYELAASSCKPTLWGIGHWIERYWKSLHLSCLVT